MRTVTIMVGMPCAGKSTYIEKHITNTKVIGMDTVLARYMEEYDCSYKEAFNSHARRAGKQVKQELNAALANGEDFVYDQTNVSVKARARIIDKVRACPHKYVIKCVFLDTSAGECKLRSLEREILTGKHVHSKVIGTMALSLEPPSFEEGFDLIIEKR